MDFDKLLKWLFKHPELLFFLLAVVGPVIKAVLEGKKKKRQQQLGRSTAAPPASSREEVFERKKIPEPEKEPEELELPWEREEQPAPPPPLAPEPAPVFAREMKSEPIEHASDDVVAEVEAIGRAAEAGSSWEADLAVPPSTAAAPGLSAEVVQANRVERMFEGWGPVEIAIVLGGALDRPAGLQEPGSSGPVGLAY